MVFPAFLETRHEQDVIPLPAFGLVAGGKDILRGMGGSFGVSQGHCHFLDIAVFFFHDFDQGGHALT